MAKVKVWLRSDKEVLAEMKALTAEVERLQEALGQPKLNLFNKLKNEQAINYAASCAYARLKDTNEDLTDALETLILVADVGVGAIPTGKIRESVTEEIINARAALNKAQGGNDNGSSAATNQGT